MSTLPTKHQKTPEDRSTPWVFTLLAAFLILGITPGITLTLPVLLVLAVGGYFGLHLWRSWRWGKGQAFHSVFLGKGEFCPRSGARWIYHLALARAEIDLTEAYRSRPSLGTEVVVLLGEVRILVPPGTRVGCRLRGLAADLSLPPSDSRAALKLDLDIRALFGVVRVEEK